MPRLTQEDVDRFLGSLTLKALLGSAISEFWLPLGLAAGFLAAARWTRKPLTSLPSLIVLVWAYAAQMAHIGMMDGCAWGFEVPRQLLVSLLSLAMVLLLLAFSPQRPGSQPARVSFRLAPTVAVLSVFIDWGLVVMAVYPIQPPSW